MQLKSVIIGGTDFKVFDDESSDFETGDGLRLFFTLSGKVVVHWELISRNILTSKKSIDEFFKAS